MISWVAFFSPHPHPPSTLKKNKPKLYLFIYLAALGLGCSMWDLVPWPGNEPGSPELGAHSLSHWTTREVPLLLFEWKHWASKNVSCPKSHSQLVAEPGWDAQAACHPSLGWRIPGSQSPQEWETTALLTPGNLAKGEKHLRWSDRTTPSTPNSSLAGLPFFLCLYSHQASCIGIRRATNAQGNLPWGTDGLGVGSQNCSAACSWGLPCRPSLWWDLVSPPPDPMLNSLPGSHRRKGSLSRLNTIVLLPWESSFVSTFSR